MPAPTVSVRDLYNWLQADREVDVLDVRDRAEFDAWCVDGPGVTARHTPYMEVVAAGVSGDAASVVPDGLREPVVVVCAVGEASAEVAESLRAEGVDAVNLEGGMDAWGAFVTSHDLGNGVVQFERPSSGCLSYLLVDGDAAAVVDPLAAAVDAYVEAAAARDATITHAIDSHVHADHVSGVRGVADATAAARVLPAGATERGLAVDADVLATDGDEIAVGDRTLGVTHAPGHTSEHLVFSWGDDLLTGDCLFLDGVGRPDLEDADAARELAGRQYDTLGALTATADERRVMPGHVTPSTTHDGRDGGVVGSLAAVAAELSMLDLDRAAFVDHVTTGLPPRPANDEAIVAVNLGETAIDEDTLALERGPNNCAVSGD
ncbi:MBL fold metallo-hydrolase [Halobacterium sp. MBLA0001]|uniref:MBL fold metallo-hydrolase n=1 Tax=Halobacterium sp. MBLA0001 TaxID=3413511 RepID=UPI003C70672F